MNEIKVCLIGYGRMGHAIEEFLAQENCKLVYVVKGDEKWDIEQMRTCDVAIEFSVPTVAFANISRCIELGIPVVSGTTGWLERLPDIHLKLQEYPDSSFLYGSNFSIGMNLFFYLNEYAAKLMENGEYYPQISEIHHLHKLDSPSGTAITLAEGIINSRNDVNMWTLDESKSEGSVHIEAIREPDVPGTHSIKYENAIDKIEITHVAKSRDGFALGAIKAAKWLVGQKGYFTMRDYIRNILQLES